MSIALLALFALSLPASLAREAHEQRGEGGGTARWPVGLAVGVLAGAGIGAAFVSDWFVDGLTPAIDALGISETFAGLVIVAIAGNAVENVVGIQLAGRNQADYALSVILQSPLQIALVLAPVLVLAAPAGRRIVHARPVTVAHRGAGDGRLRDGACRAGRGVQLARRCDARHALCPDCHSVLVGVSHG